MSKKIADQLVETLGQAGIKRIYAVTGDSLNQVNDAVRRSRGEMEWVHVRHEETGAFAAAAEAELNGIACCAGSSGPGHVHLINGLYDAHRNNVPVLAIASTCGTSELGTDYFQETNTIKLFDDCSGYNQIAQTPAQFSRMLQGALQHAVHREEVAVLGLPGDLAALKAEDNVTARFVLPSENLSRPSDRQLIDVADLINSAESVTLFCGMGCRDAHDEVIDLANKIQSPVAYTFKSKMEVQYDNPFDIGMTGLLGTTAAYKSMHEGELLILLGTDFPYQNFMPSGKKIVQIDVRPERIGRRAKVDMGLSGQIKQTIAALLPLLKTKTDSSFLKEQLRHYDHVKKNLAATASKKGRKGAVSPEYVATVLDALASPEAIFTVDTGMCCVWGARYINATAGRKMLGSFKHGSMANALPMAIGAAFARPGQQVIAMCGDGGLSMLLGDLATIVQYKLPVKIIIFNNRSLGMVKLEMEVAGLPDWQTDMVNPDFVKVAESLGLKGYTIDEAKKVPSVVKMALEAEGPVLVNVRTDPDALAMPPKIEFDYIKGFATAMGKLVFDGRAGEVMSTIRSNMKHIKELI